MYRCVIHVSRRVIVAVRDEVSSPAQELLHLDKRDQKAVRVVLPGLLNLVAALDQVRAVGH